MHSCGILSDKKLGRRTLLEELRKLKLSNLCDTSGLLPSEPSEYLLVLDELSLLSDSRIAYELLSSSGEYYSSIDRSSGADFKTMPAPIDQSGNQRVMSQKVSAGKPRQSQPEHEWSRKTQTGQTQRQHFDKIFLQTYFGAFSLHCWHG